MTYRKQLLAAASLLALLPATAQATAYTWTGPTSGTWDTVADWSNSPPAGGPSGTGNTATISTTNTTVQLNTSPATLGTLTLGSTDTLQVNSGGNFSANNVNGSGTVTGSATFGGTATANSAGAALTFNGASFTGTMNTSTGYFNLSNVSIGTTANGITLGSGTTTGVPIGNGNNSYGLYNISGTSYLNGPVRVSNYDTFNITGGTLNLSNLTWNTNWATNTPNTFVVNAGATLNNYNGNSNTMAAPISLNGGSITNNSGSGAGTTAGTLTLNGLTTGTGTISGPIKIVGGLRVSGGIMTVDGSNGAITGTTGGWSVSAGSVLKLKGQINLSGLGGPQLSNSGILAFDIFGANNFAQLNYSNGNAIGGTVEFDFLNFTPTAGETFEFYTYTTGAAPWTDPLSNILVTGLAPGLTYELDAVAGGEVLKINGPSVPEPATAALLGGGFLALGFTVRRRKAA